MRIPKLIQRMYHFVVEVYFDYGKDNGSLVAAAVSFYVFLSLIPMLLLGVAIAAGFLGSPQRAEDIILSAIKSNAPNMALGGQFDIRKIVDEIIQGRGVATGIGILTLLWTGTSVFANLEQAINLAWNTQVRGFFKRRLMALGLLVLMGVLLGVSFGITAAANAIRSLDISIFGIRPGEWPWVWTMVGIAVPLLVSILTFTIFYWIVPNTHVPVIVALAGGSFAGALWEIAKYGFSYYATHFANYSAVYGSLAGVILLLVWIYYSAIVVIMGAEVASVYAGRRVPSTG